MASIRKKYEEVPVVKKLPDVLTGKISTIKIIIKGEGDERSSRRV